MRLTIFLVSLFLGIACLVAGMFLTRLTWRPEIEPFDRGTSVLQMTLHPERFAGPRYLRIIRPLNFTGAALILCAIGVVVYEGLLSVA